MLHTRLHLKQTESTNDVGGQWLKTAKAGEILMAWTSDQTRGRGQRGNTWDQSPGLDLALTVAVKWPAEAPPRDPVVLNKSVTAGIRNSVAAVVEVRWNPH
jgi:BirA family biotin operon repressor/biotin-[acetyl-CoA-carboxylase] ligase